MPYLMIGTVSPIDPASPDVWVLWKGSTTLRGKLTAPLLILALITGLVLLMSTPAY